MKFYCNGCHNTRDFETEYGMLVATAKEGIKRICRLCRKPKVFVPDVYWDGKPEENLADDPNTGKPVSFRSPGEKAAYLREKGLAEAGDRVHGAPVEFNKMLPEPVVDSQREVKIALKHVREMGRDVRRQEYLRITKEGQRRLG